VDNTDCTPLMISALNSGPQIYWPKIRVLLTSGASIHFVVNNRSVVDWARLRIGSTFADELTRLDHSLRTGCVDTAVGDTVQVCVESPGEIG